MTAESIRSSNTPPNSDFQVYASWLRRLDRLPRVLVAEDDRDLRNSLHAVFQRSGYDVRTVADGSALLERLGPMLLSEPGHWSPDVILTDIKMPGVDALSVIEELREVGWKTPAVVLTGYADQAVRSRIGGLRRVALFEKPVRMDVIESTVGDVIRLEKI